jgi:uncharacterized protein (TIGR02001 family)
VSRWLLLLLSLLQAAAGCAVDLQGSLGASSDNVFRGLTQSQGDPSVQVDGYISATHWFGGLAAESVKRQASESTGAEVIGYLGYQQLLSEEWNAALSARHYDYPGNRYRSLYHYDELSAAIGWHRQLLLELIASPNTFAAAGYDHYGSGSAYAAELSARQPLPDGFSVDGGIGYYDLRSEVGRGYAYWSAGAGKQWRNWQLGVRYLGTDAQARHLFGTLAGDRVVASVAWFF